MIDDIILLVPTQGGEWWLAVGFYYTLLYACYIYMYVLYFSPSFPLSDHVPSNTLIISPLPPLIIYHVPYPSHLIPPTSLGLKPYTI